MVEAVFDKDGYAENNGTYQAYVYDTNTKELQGLKTLNAYVDQSKIPNCTDIVPPVAKEGYAIIFNGTGWNYVVDYRGQTMYEMSNPMSSKVIKTFGDLPEGWTLIAPPQMTEAGQSIAWNGSGWTLKGPSILDQATHTFSQMSYMGMNMFILGKTPSAQMIQYSNELQNIIHPASQKTSYEVILDTTPSTLPPPPFPLSSLGDPNSGWWN